MDPTNASLLCYMLVILSTGWIIFNFTTRIVERVLGKLLKGRVHFRFSRFHCVKDVSIQFTKGPLASVVVGEINFKLLLMMLNLSSLQTSKLQLCFSRVEVFFRKPVKSQPRIISQQKSHNQKKAPGQSRTWPIIAQCAKHIDLTLTDVVVKVIELPDLSLEIKELCLDTFQMEHSTFDSLGVSLVVAPVNIYMQDRQCSDESLSSPVADDGVSFMLAEGHSMIFSLEKLSVNSNLDYVTGRGLLIQQIDVSCGEASVNLSEDLLFSETGFVRRFLTKNKSGKGEQSSVVSRPDGEQVMLTKQVSTDKPAGLLKKSSTLLPEKFGFSLPKLSINCSQRGGLSTMKTTVRGISMHSCLSKSPNQGGEIANLGGIANVCDTRLYCGETTVVEGIDGSLVHIQRVSVVATVEMQPKMNCRQQVEINANLEGTRCNLYLNIVEDLLKFCLHIPRKPSKPKFVLDAASPPVKKKKSKSKVCWVCKISAPEMAVTAYDTLGITLSRLNFGSLQFFVDNVSGPAWRMQLEVGELKAMLIDEVYDDCTASRESSASCIIHLGGLVMEWGKSELRFEGEDKAVRSCSVIIVECSQISIHLSAIRIQALLTMAMAVMRYVKSTFGQKLKAASKSGAKVKGESTGPWRKIEVGVQGLMVQFCGPGVVDEVDVVDAKTVNFGDQGGKAVISHNPDGVLRTASIKSTGSIVDYDAVCKATFNEVLVLISIDSHRKNLQVSLDHGEVTHEQLGIKDKVVSMLTMLAIQNLELLYEGGKESTGFPGRLLLSITNVDGCWNPDVHLFYYDVSMQLAVLGRRLSGKPKDDMPGDKVNTSGIPKVGENKQKLRLALDLEKLDFTAKITEEIDFALHVQSLVSEDVEIGLLVEDAHLIFNDAEVLHLEQAQICRLPCSSPDAVISSGGVDWKVSIHATKIHVVMPFRLQLRVIEDATEDMWRVLKLIMRAQKSKWKPLSALSDQNKIKKPPARIQSVLASVDELSFAIEEEPLQGWLDEHHHLMEREVCKLLVQERVLEEKQHQGIYKGGLDSQSPARSDYPASRVLDVEWETLQKDAFNAYRQACERLVVKEGSGACKVGLQSGFRVSTKRRSLFLVHATNVEMNLSSVKGSMIDVIRMLDCVDPSMQVPYAKIYGRHLSIQASALVAQLRDFSSPLLKTGVLECEGNIIVAQQARSFPLQMKQQIKLGQLRTVEVWRSISGATPAYKTFFDLSIEVDTGDISYGVGYEPVFADVTYAFTIALQKAKPVVPVVKKERSLPWWDDMRYYIHGRNCLKVKNFTWSLQATTNPYEDKQLLQFVATTMVITQSEGSVVFSADDFEWVICRRASARQSHALADHEEKLSVLQSPQFKMEIIMDWKCESGNPLNHYLHPFPNNANPPAKKFDLFRSTSLSLTFAFSLDCPSTSSWNLKSPASFLADLQGISKAKILGAVGFENCPSGHILGVCTSSNHMELLEAQHDAVPTIYFCSQELKWIFRLWNLFYSPPHKLRSFSRWPRFGIKKAPRSGNLSLDKVMTEYLLRVDSTPGCIKHRSNLDVDPAHGLTFSMRRLRYELLYSRCQSHFESTGPREPLTSVYQGLDLSMLSAGLDKVSGPIPKHNDVVQETDREDKVMELLGLQDGVNGESVIDSLTGTKKVHGIGFLLSMDCFTLRKQAPKAGLSQLSALLHYKRISRSNKVSDSIGIDSGSDRSHSDASDDEGFNVVLADNCLRVSVYGLKLLWTLTNRDAVWSWVEDFSRAFASAKPSPSRQAAQRRLMEMKEIWVNEKADVVSHRLKEQSADTSEEEGIMHFMVNVVQPQFNLDSEDAQGRLLLAAASGRVLARSFHSIVAVGLEVIAHALRQDGELCTGQGGVPVIAWKRRELSVILEHVQAHVAPTNVDLGAGLQWLPKIPTGAQKLRRTGALLERVFMPCSMYFQYTRHKGGTTDCKVKPLKELSFNSPNITATMTSNQFHIMVDVISNLLLARLPKRRKRPLVHYVGEETCTDEEGEEELDEVVPEGVEEVEVARIKLEQAERDCRAVAGHWSLIKNLWFEIQSSEILMLEKEFVMTCKARRLACETLRAALQGAAQQRLMEKEKHRTPLAAMRISWAIDKFGWSMLCDGESFAEAEISSMILNVDRDFNDIGVARFTTKWFAVKNCLPGAKSSTVLSPWNPPAEWGRNVMLRVDAKQGAPMDGPSLLELFQVEIYPLRIYLTEAMYTMMWDYLFPEEDHDTVQRQTVRIQHQKVSTAVSNGKSGSFIKTVDEKEVDFEEVNSKATPLPMATVLRTSMVSSLQMSGHEDVPSPASVNSGPSVDSVKSKEPKSKKGNRLSLQEEKKFTEEKKVTRLQKSLLEFHNIRISQVELLVTYEGSRFSVNDMRLLMDTFARLEFTGTWRRLFSKVKKHIIWSVLKSVTGMQGKKFKDKLPAQVHDGDGIEDSNSSDSNTSQVGHEDQFPISRFRRHTDRAGEGFVSSIRGLFNSQKRKAKALVKRKLSIDLRNSVDSMCYLSGGDADSATSPQDFGNMIKAKRLLQRHSRKLRSSGSQKGGSFGMQSQSSSSSSPRHPAVAEFSDGSSDYEDVHE